MNKHHFHTLLSRYKTDQCTEQEKRLVEQWFSLLDAPANEDSFAENQRLEEKIWRAIQYKQRPVLEHTQPVSVFKWRWAVAAAVLLGLLWGGYQFNSSNYFNQGIVNTVAHGLLNKSNSTKKPMTFTLEDGSVISLSPGSSLLFPAKFKNDKREVFLSGKAFFQVARNPQKPFLVYSGDIATKVLGTSFWIDHGKDNSETEVSVVTGKVSVFSHNNNNQSEYLDHGIVLTPNQKVNYSPLTKTFVTGLSREPVMLPAYENAFAFDDTPFPKVLKVIEQAYGIRIIIENEKLKTCLVTADIGKLPMYIKLELICASVNAHYRVAGTKILVSGKGCH